jgi:hypothetical protein
LDKRVEIVDDGPRDQVVIEAAGCVLMQTDYALVRGLTLRGRHQNSEAQVSTVRIPTGQLVVADAVIEAKNCASRRLPSCAIIEVVQIFCMAHVSKEPVISFLSNR